MIFARYKGPNVGEGRFVAGKTYLVAPEMESSAVGTSFVTVVDEDAVKVRIDPEQGRFLYLDESYAVVLNPFEDFDPGEVVTLSGASDDGILFDIKGMGYRSASDLALLDWTNVKPGICVFDSRTGRWEPVLSVDDCLSVVVGGESRELTEFRMPVKDGLLVDRPYAECINAVGALTLTEGRIYYLLGEQEDTVEVADDEGFKTRFARWRFDL